MSEARAAHASEISRLTAPFEQLIEPVRVSLLYRVGLACVAVAMVLLPNDVRHAHAYFGAVHGRCHEAIDRIYALWQQALASLVKFVTQIEGALGLPLLG